MYQFKLVYGVMPEHGTRCDCGDGEPGHPLPLDIDQFPYSCSVTYPSITSPILCLRAATLPHRPPQDCMKTGSIDPNRGSNVYEASVAIVVVAADTAAALGKGRGGRRGSGRGMAEGGAGRAGGGDRGGRVACAEDGVVAGRACGGECVYGAFDEQALWRKILSSAEGEACGRRMERAKAGGVLVREGRASRKEGEGGRMQQRTTQ